MIIELLLLVFAAITVVVVLVGENHKNNFKIFLN